MKALATTELTQAYALIRTKKPFEEVKDDETVEETTERMKRAFIAANTQAYVLKPRLILMSKAFLQEAEETLDQVTFSSPAVHPVPGPLTQEQDTIAHALSAWRVMQLWHGAYGKEALLYKEAMYLSFEKTDPRAFDSPVLSLVFMSGRNAEHRSAATGRVHSLGTMARTALFAPPTERSWLTTESPLLGNMCLVYMLLHGTRDTTVLKLAHKSVKHNVRFCGWLVLTWGDAMLQVLDEEVYADEKAADYLLIKREHFYRNHPKARKTLTIMTREPSLRFFRGVDMVDTQQWTQGFELEDPLGTVAPLYL